MVFWHLETVKLNLKGIKLIKSQGDQSQLIDSPPPGTLNSDISLSVI